jgi:predicted transcriptional regulator
MARLGELEQEVMTRLWDSMGAELTVRNVAVTFPDHAYTTVLTVLDRLERKGMVRRIKDGRAYRYVAVASREAYTSALMREALGAAKDPRAVLVRFAETVTPEEAAVLRKALSSIADRTGKAGSPDPTEVSG